MTKPKTTPSVVSRVALRVTPFIGRAVAVQTTHRPDAPTVGELVALELLGSAYFLHVRNASGRSRFVNVVAVIEIDDIDPNVSPAIGAST